jgi:hypothetical protein
MATIVIRPRTGAARPIGLARLGARVQRVARRAVLAAATAALVGALGAVVVQLVAELLSFPVPVAIIGVTVLTAGLLGWLLGCLRSQLRTGKAKRRRVSGQV